MASRIGTCENTTSAREVQLANEISIFPNPAATVANITIDTDGTEIFTLSLTTLTGKLVRQVTNVNGRNHELDKGNLAPGIYFLKIADANGKFATEKIVFN